MTAPAAQPIAPAPRRIPWRGGPQLDEWTEQQYRDEQADHDDYDLYGEDL